MSQPDKPTEALHRDWFGETFAKQAGESAAINDITHAERIANAKAARLLAERECPPDLIEWGRAHGIPTFAEVTWQAGFLVGMRVAMLEKAKERETDAG